MADDNPLLGGPLELPEDLTDSNQPVHRDPKPKKPWKKILIIVLVVIVLVALAFGGYRLFFSSDKQSSSPAPQSSVVTPKPTSNTTDIPGSTSTKEYENGFLGVTFVYPTNWKVTESENQDDIRVESPEFTYATVDKGNVKGYFRLYVRKGARDSETKYIGKGFAIAPSVKLVYSKPAAGQRTETLLTNFGIDDPSNFGFFMIAGNFDLKKGDSLGPSYGTERETYIIGGGYTTKALTDPLATNQVPVNNFQQTNSYKQAMEIVKSIQIK